MGSNALQNGPSPSAAGVVRFGPVQRSNANWAFILAGNRKLDHPFLGLQDALDQGSKLFQRVALFIQKRMAIINTAHARDGVTQYPLGIVSRHPSAGH